jgi:uncharacterized protein
MTASMPLAARIVATSCRKPWVVLLLGLALGAAALLYTARNFAITTDTAELLSPNLPWRQHRAAFNQVFPQHVDTILAVIDAETPELADAAASRLAARLEADLSHFRSVRQLEGGPFFEKNGLLLLPLAEVQAATEQLIAAQPILGTLAADPSLRGVMTSLSVILEGIYRGDARLQDVQRTMAALSDTFQAAEEERPAVFSWRRLMSGTAPGTRDARRFVLVHPVLEYAALTPGAAASAAIRNAARDLKLDAAHGVRLRLTGPVPLADEEFETLADNAALMTTAMALALLVILWLAVRSARFVLAIVVTTLLGLVLTAGAGLLAMTRFNLISVAFIPLFVGLGIDFAIQVCVRCRAERLVLPDLEGALVATGAGLGASLALAAAAITAGFFAFLPTNYVGLSELGAISGLGMIIAFALSLTFLPALLVLLRPPGGGANETGFTLLAPVERLLAQHRRRVLWAGAAAAAASAALLPMLQFDFDPLHLRSSRGESMSTLAELLADPDRTPHTIDVLAPSLTEANALARRLTALPEVSRAITLSTFVPTQQEEKLALITDAAMLLAPTLDPVEVQPAPSDLDLVQAMSAAAKELRRVADATDGQPVVDAQHLAAVLERLATGPEGPRATAAHAVLEPLRTLLRQTRTLLQADAVTLDTLPPQLVADWMAKDGRARVLVFPAGGAHSNAELRRFSDAIQSVVPEATGTPIIIRESGDSIVSAFLQAAVLSGFAVIVLLGLVLRRTYDVTLAVAPVLLSGMLTLASCALLGLPLNYANIIALPLLIGVGVAFNIYFVAAWRAGEADLVQSSLMRAVVFSALTTSTAFGALWMSSHPGTASMGRLLMIGLGWELVITLLLRPALLARPARQQGGSPGSARAG